MHQAEQNETIICNVEKTTKQTCEIYNESVVQTQSQSQITANLNILLETYKNSHGEAFLHYQNLKNMQDERRECCPPKEEEKPCKYQPCPKPEALEQGKFKLANFKPISLIIQKSSKKRSN